MKTQKKETKAQFTHRSTILSGLDYMELYHRAAAAQAEEPGIENTMLAPPSKSWMRAYHFHFVRAARRAYRKINAADKSTALGGESTAALLAELAKRGITSAS